jgi:cell wall-associated NlpC family hydrolase
MDPADLGVGSVLGGMGRGGMMVVGGLALLLVLPILAVAALLGSGAPADEPGVVAGPLPAAVSTIPPDQLVVMQQVGLASGIPWPLLAAIAKVESDFGRNMATSWAGAIGYGQFLPSSWAAFGRGGNPYDYRDALPAMARYLLAHGAPAELRRAVYAYNHDWSYVDQVLRLAAGFGLGTGSAAQVGAGPNLSARVVQLALAQRGKPYVFGAAGPDAFDCSGLVQWAFRQLGVTAPRTAQAQYAWARPVSVAELAPGDLVFYERTYPSPDRITHVGIYAGSGEVVMATAIGGAVRLERLDTPYWRAHFVAAGRPPMAESAFAVATASREVQS